MVFVGYDQHVKGYRCLNPETGKVIISRDVIFLDNSSPKFHLEIDDDEEKQRTNTVENNETEQLEKTLTEFSSPSNNVELDDTVVTLHNNTSRNDDFKAVEMDADETIPTSGDDNDKTFTTRARIDQNQTPRKSSRAKLPFVPFQISHLAFLSTEPSDVADALEGEESIHWKKAMDEEKAAHQKNGTWQMTQLPIGGRAIAGKWVFKRKTNSSGEITSYKARYVAKGFTQRYGRDYYETFSPVVRHSTIHFLFALAAQKGWKIHQMDAETAFLQGDLHETVYMMQADAYDDGSGRVYHLKKAIYGLKQASRMWNLKLNEVLLSYGFKRSKIDPCVYISTEIIVTVYVDDFLILYAREDQLFETKSVLYNNFSMKDIGLASSCLGININQGENFIEIDQSHYIERVLEVFGMTDCKPANTPSDVNVKMSITMWNEANSLVGKVPYQELIGSLLYLAGATRPDIAFAVNDLSRFNKQHAEPHWKALKRILRYLRGTITMKIRYERGEKNYMVTYSDADWGSDSDKRRSCTGYVVKMSNGAISWCSQRQSIVALSSTESEYIALSSTVREILWVKQLAKECGERKLSPVVIHCDNQSAIDLTDVEAFRPRTKHIDIRFHHTREKIECGIIDLKFIPTEKMVADSLTKPVSSQKTKLCCEGVCASKFDTKAKQYIQLIKYVLFFVLLIFHFTVVSKRVDH